MDSILKKVDILETSPRSGRKVPEINREEFREIIFGNYRIIYRIEEEQLSILTVRYGKQILPIEEILA